MIRINLLSIFLFFAFSHCTIQSTETEELKKTVSELNAKCPQMLDSETRIDRIEVREPNTLLYKYTLINITADKVDTLEFRRILWPGIVSNIRVSREMKKLRDNKTIILYDYRDKSGKSIYLFTVSPEDYQ
jgi:hypothetical protein